MAVNFNSCQLQFHLAICFLCLKGKTAEIHGPFVSVYNKDVMNRQTGIVMFKKGRNYCHNNGLLKGCLLALGTDETSRNGIITLETVCDEC